MLFMVIEQFRSGPGPVRERFIQNGRMLPGDVQYLGSWIDPRGERCFQVMEAESEDRLEEWTRHWADLVDFSIIPVLASQQYWTQIGERES